MIQRAAVAGSLGALLLLLSVGAPVRPGASRVESAGRSASASLLPFMDRRGQAPTEAPDTGPRPDSVRALRAAKAALRESGTSAWTSRIARVIEELDAQAREIPGDGWIAGHRVGLRMKQGDFADALAVALDCQAAAWWCAALEGLALHAKGDFVEAESAFDRALEAMPRGERCDWLNELRPVLSGDLAKEYGRLSCSGRADLEHRIWWLADPLYLRPGNDRRTEHLARVVSMHLHHQVLELRGGRCPTDHHEPVLRGGWTPDWGESYAHGSPAAERGYRFIPTGAAGVRPLEASPSDFRIATSTWERYDPPYGRIRELDQQVAFFRRGDSVAVAASAELTDHELAREGPLKVGMILARDENDRPTIVRQEGTANDRYVFRAVVPAEPHLVSVEAFSEKSAARARFGHGLPEPGAGELALSDVLIFDWSEGIENRLDAVARWMLGTSRIRRERPVGVFWETYGLRGGEAVEVAVTVTARRGVVGRALSAIGLSTREGVRISWLEGVDDAGAAFVGRSLGIDLSRLTSGDYTLELAIQTADGRTASASREIEIVD